MDTNKLGIIIRQLRIEKGLTQAELAEGICSKDYIYKIEKGTKLISAYILQLISKKLNENLDDYYKILLDNSSLEAYDKIILIRELLRSNDYVSLKKEILSIENDDCFLSGENLQILLNAKSICAAELDKDYNKAIKIAFEAIEIGKNSFVIDNFIDSLFTYTELCIINNIACNYANKLDYSTAISIFQGLLFNMEKYHSNTINYTYINSILEKELYLSIIYNLSKYLCITNQLFLALETVQKGISFSIKTNINYNLPELVYNKFTVLYKSNDYVGAKECFDYCIMLFKLRKDLKCVEFINKIAKEKYPLIYCRRYDNTSRIN